MNENPLLRLKTEADGSDPFRVGSLVRRRVEVPPGSEVEIWQREALEQIATEIRDEAEIAARPGQFDRLNALANLLWTEDGK